MWNAHALSKTFVSSLHSHLLYIDQAFIAFDPSIIRRHKVLRLLLRGTAVLSSRHNDDWLSSLSMSHVRQTT